MPSTSYAWASGSLFFGFFLLIIFSNIAVYNSQIVCPQSAQQLQEALTGSGSNIITQVSAMIGTFLSPCSGLDWWVYLLIFVPLAFGIIAFLTPLIG